MERCATAIAESSAGESRGHAGRLDREFVDECVGLGAAVVLATSQVLDPFLDGLGIALLEGQRGPEESELVVTFVVVHSARVVLRRGEPLLGRHEVPAQCLGLALWHPPSPSAVHVAEVLLPSHLALVGGLAVEGQGLAVTLGETALAILVQQSQPGLRKRAPYRQQIYNTSGLSRNLD